MKHSIENARKVAGRIEGRLTEKEGIFLFNAAKNVSGKGVIVEIGSWKGRSTVFLGCGSKAGNSAKVYAIDPHDGGLGGKPKSLNEFKNNIRASNVDDVVEPLVKTSEEAHKAWRLPIELLWIDGAHDYENVEKDFRLWSSHLVNGGRIAFHDSTNEDGPNLVVGKFVFNSDKFRDCSFVDSITFATKVAHNSFTDRMKNHCVLLIKTVYELLTVPKIPALVRAKVPAQFRKFLKAGGRKS